MNENIPLHFATFCVGWILLLLVLMFTTKKIV